MQSLSFLLFGRTEADRIGDLERPYITSFRHFTPPLEEDENQNPASLELANLFYEPIRTVLVAASALPKLAAVAPSELVESLYLFSDHMENREGDDDSDNDSEDAEAGDDDDDDEADALTYFAVTSNSFIKNDADYTITNYIGQKYNLKPNDRVNGALELKSFYSPHIRLLPVDEGDYDDLGFLGRIKIFFPLSDNKNLQQLFNRKETIVESLKEKINGVLRDQIVNDRFSMRLDDLTLTTRSFYSGQYFVADYHNTQVYDYPIQLVVSLSIVFTDEKAFAPGSGYVKRLEDDYNAKRVLKAKKE